VLIDFYPNGERAEFFSQSMQASLSDSLAYLLELVEDNISETEFIKTKDVIENIRNCKRVPGYAYALNQQLLSAIEQQNINNVHQAIESLVALKLHNQDDIAIMNFSSLGLEKKQYELGNIVFEDDTNKIKLPPCADDVFQRAKRDIKNVLELISKIDKDIYGEIINFINELWLFDLPYNNGFSSSFSSATSFKFFGTVTFNVELKYPSIICHIDKLCHETTHLYLLSLPERDSLVLNPPEKIYRSPIRHDLRTMAGVYHATIVLARILYVFQKIKDNGAELQNEFYIFDTLVPEYTYKFYEGLKTIRQQGKLSGTGKVLIDEAEDYVNKFYKVSR
jgi:hypothetical protein